MTFKLTPRYALEPVEVALSGGAQSGVVLTNVHVHADLSPDQARSLAVALIEHAARAERAAPDDWTRGVDR